MESNLPTKEFLKGIEAGDYLDMLVCQHALGWKIVIQSPRGPRLSGAKEDRWDDYCIRAYKVDEQNQYQGSWDIKGSSWSGAISHFGPSTSLSQAFEAVERAFPEAEFGVRRIAAGVYRAFVDPPAALDPNLEGPFRFTDETAAGALCKALLLAVRFDHTASLSTTPMRERPTAKEIEQRTGWTHVGVHERNSWDLDSHEVRGIPPGVKASHYNLCLRDEHGAPISTEVIPESVWRKKGQVNA